MDEWTRRDLLGGTGAVAVAALAGCSTDLLGGSGDQPEPFRRWAVAPSNVEGGDRVYATLAVKPRELTAVDSPWTNDMASTLPNAGALEGALTVGDLDHFQRVGPTVVLAGGFDAGDVLNEIDAGADGTDRVEGYRTGRFGANGYLAAKNDRAVVGSNREDVAAVVGAYEGSTERLADASEPGGTLLDHLGTGTVAAARIHEPGERGFAGALAEGFAVAVGEEETTATGAVVFESGAGDREGVVEWATEPSTIDAEAIETSTPGDAVVVTATVPTADLSELWMDYPQPAGQTSPETTPQVRFQFEYEPTGSGQGRLTITHTSGDAVDAGNLFVRGSGFADVPDVDQTEPGPWQGGTNEGQVMAGNRVTVGVTSAYDVTVVWESEDAAGSAPLAADEGPDA